jgi:hypothetical protein
LAGAFLNFDDAELTPVLFDRFTRRAENGFNDFKKGKQGLPEIGVQFRHGKAPRGTPRRA